jgi:hypothetical protein
MWVSGLRYAPGALPPGKQHAKHCSGGCVGLGPIWTGVENLAPLRVYKVGTI